MDNTRGDTFEPAQGTAEPGLPARRAQRRGWVAGALVRIGLALLVLGAAGFQAYAIISDRPEPVRRQAMERTFTVAAQDPVHGTHSAVVRSFGQVVATRSVDIRSQVQGQVVEVSPNLSAGSRIERGETLLRIDPYTYEGAVVEAMAAQADARLSLREAEEALRLEQVNIETARNSLETAQTDLDRARSLLNSGSVTQQTVETRALLVAERQQALTQRESNLVGLQGEIDRRTAQIEQARWQLDQAQRNLENTTMRAPFSGIIVSETVTEGSYVTANEVVVSMYDETALNVRFTLSDQQYGQLVADGLPGRPLVATWNLRPRPIAIEARISRAAPEINAATGGVELYATLTGENASQVRPGTFVQLAIDGVEHADTLLVPETAVYDENHLYVIRDGRMARVDVEILDRDNSHLIIRADLAEGERIITTRLSQAGSGVAVMVEGEEPAFAGRPGGGPGSGSGSGSGPGPGAGGRAGG